MKIALVSTVLVLFAGALQAQSWEAGVAVGGGYYRAQDLTSSAGTASATFRNNLAGSVWIGNNAKGHLGGEIRFDYQRGDSDLSQGSTHANMRAASQDVHYDVLWHFRDSESSVRPFVAVGGGVKQYRGTGSGSAFQPLSGIALLTQANDLTPMISVGLGVKARIGSHIQLRAEVHDYVTPFPSQVITPLGKAGTWVHDIVPALGLAFLF